MTDSQSYQQVHKLGVDSGVVLVGNVLDKLFGFAFAVGIAKLYGLKVFGLFVLGFTLVRLVSVVINLGFGKGLIRFVSLYADRGDEARLKGIIWSALGLSVPFALFVGVILFVAADPIVRHMFGNRQRLTLVLESLAVALPWLALTGIWLRSLVGLKRFKPQIYVNSVIEPAVRVGVALVLFLMGYRLDGLIIAYLMAVAASVMVAYGYFFRAFHHRFKGVRPVFQFRELLSFSWPLLLRNLVSRASRRADILLLGAFRGPAEITLYTFALRLASLNTLITSAFQKAYTPHIAPLHAEARFDELRRGFQTVTRWMMLLTVPAFAMLIFFPRAVIPVLGEQFESAAQAVSIVTLAVFFSYAVGPSETAIIMSGRSKTSLAIRVISGVVALGLNIGLVPSHGIVGAALAFAGSVVLANALAAGIAYRDMKLHPLHMSYIKVLIAGAIATGIGALSHTFLPGQKYVAFLALGLIMVSTYGASLFLMGVDREDRYAFQRLRARLGRALGRGRFSPVADAEIRGGH